MALKIFAIAVLLTIVIAYMWLMIYRSLNRRESLMKIGSDLVRPQGVFKLYRQHVQTIRLLERILQSDKTMPILSDTNRIEAERLVETFYDNKGE